MIRSVFVIEKVEFLSTLMDLALTRDGVYTFTHTDLNCVHYIVDFEPEVLILDAQTFSLGDGQEFFNTLKKDLKRPLIILGMGDAGEESLFKEFENKLQGFMEKPLPVSGLFDKISTSITL